MTTTLGYSLKNLQKLVITGTYSDKFHVSSKSTKCGCQSLCSVRDEFCLKHLQFDSCTRICWSSTLYTKYNYKYNFKVLYECREDLEHFMKQFPFAYFLVYFTVLCRFACACGEERLRVSQGNLGPWGNLILHFLWARPHSGGQVTKQHAPVGRVLTWHNSIRLPCSRGAGPTAEWAFVYSYVCLMCNALIKLANTVCVFVYVFACKSGTSRCLWQLQKVGVCLC